jgi:mannose-6-phosphate isomerase-like protein (cupin superfamily)
VKSTTLCVSTRPKEASTARRKLLAPPAGVNVSILPSMETGTSVARLDHEAPERFVPLRRQLGVSSFGVNQIILRPGERGRIHAHERQEEVYIVLRGTLTVEVEGEPRDLAADEAIRLAPGVRRRILNRGPGPCSILALGGASPHEGRDGIAWADWDDAQPRTPQEIPLPDDLPASEIRTT